MSWREEPITEKQQRCIDYIYGFTCIEFKGKNKGEACDYIKKHLEEAERRQYKAKEFYREFKKKTRNPRPKRSGFVPGNYDDLDICGYSRAEEYH